MSTSTAPFTMAGSAATRNTKLHLPLLGWCVFAAPAFAATELPFPVTVVGSLPTDFARGDLNGDGLLDVVVAGVEQKGVVVLLGTGDSRFQRAPDAGAPVTTRAIRLADLDGDSVLDVVATWHDYATGSSGFLSLRGAGDGTLQAGSVTLCPVGVELSVLGVGDVDGDQQADVVLGRTNSADPTVLVYRGAGGGAFSAFVAVNLGPQITDLFVEDVDQDGRLDLGCLRRSILARRFSWSKGLGGGQFGPPSTFVVDARTELGKLVDLDGDALPELVTHVRPAGLTTGDNRLQVRMNQGLGVFGAASDILLSHPFARLIAVVDASGDLVRDVIVANDAVAGFEIHLGVGDGTFAAPVAVHSPIVPSQFFDANGDGSLDGFALGSDGIVVVLGRGPAAFEASFPTQLRAERTLVADVSNDGALDIVGTGLQSGIGVSLGLSQAPSFSTPTYLSPSFSPGAFRFSDLDGDGDLDLVALDLQLQRNRVRIFVNDGAGGFHHVRRIDGPSGLSDVVVADLDRDGQMDIAVAAADVLVYPGRGSLSYGDPYRVPISTGGFAIATGDLDLDGDADLVVTNLSGFDVLLAQPSGRLTRMGAHLTGSGPLALHDLDGDGILDLVVYGPSPALDELQIHHGLGDGTFVPAAILAADFGFSLTVGDIDSDGLVDILSTTFYGCGVDVHRGAGLGAFHPRERFATECYPMHPALADVDSDSDLDLVVANQFNGSVVVHINR